MNDLTETVAAPWTPDDANERDDGNDAHELDAERDDYLAWSKDSEHVTLDESNRIRAALTKPKWQALHEMYDFLVSEECDDGLDARKAQGLCGNALCGDFEAAQRAMAFIEGRITL